MCGIIAILNTELCGQQLYDGLVQIQNRGYDSTGITTITENNGAFTFLTHKYASTQNETGLQKLIPYVEEHNQNIMGIAHTRWATHGMKTDKNAHPHCSMNNIFSLVHNGIIENYKSLRDCLCERGYQMKSQTDSEVIVNMVEYEYGELLHNYRNGNHADSTDESSESSDDEYIMEHTKRRLVLKAIDTVKRQLQGTYALVIMTTETPTTFYALRHGSPLLVSHTNNSLYIASEQSAFCGKTNNYFTLENNDICMCYGRKIKYNTTEQLLIQYESYTKQTYKIREMNQLPNHILDNKYNHWMEKEIEEQEESSARAMSLGARLLSNGRVHLGGLISKKDELIDAKHVIFLGCGTSYNSALQAKMFMSEMCQHFISIQVIDGSDFHHTDIPGDNNKTMVILMSQSGETRDLQQCIKVLRKFNTILVGVVNVVDSQIAREVDCGCYLNAGREVAVASTKSFTSQVIVCALISLWLRQIYVSSPIYKSGLIQPSFYHNNVDNFMVHLRNIPYNIKNILQSEEITNQIKHWSVLLQNTNHLFILGKGDGYSVARESALKIKETTYIHAESYSTSSLKHGPLALISDDFPVILFVIDDQHIHNTITAYEEITSRGGKIFVITNSKQFMDNYYDCNGENDNPNRFIYLSFLQNNFINILMNICIQRLAYLISVNKGFNPDTPRNLAKVVTVD